MLRTRSVRMAVASAALFALTDQGLLASDGSWLGNNSANWNDPDNWADFNIPGSTLGIAGTSTDIAKFEDTAAIVAVVIDVGRNIGGLLFNHQTQTYNLGNVASNTLYLTGGGVAQVTATVTTPTTNSAISAPVVINGTTYTFRSNSPAVSGGLKLNGPVSGGAAGATTLFLDGSNLASGTGGNCQFLGPITNGASSSLGIVKDGAGIWELRSTTGQNTYSGDTLINAGTIRLNSAQGTSPNSHFIVNSGAALRPNFVGTTTARKITVNTGGLVQASGDNVFTSVASDSGPAVHYNFSTAVGNQAQGFMLNLTGTVAGEGGIKLSNQNTTGSFTFSKSIDLGTVSRPFDVAASSGNAGAAIADMQVSGNITGTGGLTKTGPGLLKLNGVANSFSGQLEIRDGSFRLNTANALTGTPPVLISGGTLNVNALTQTVGAFTMTKGSLIASSGLGTIVAPSYTFNVSAPDTATAGAVLANSGGASTLTKNGDGIATLTRTNTYTGTTTVNAGALVVVGPAKHAIISGPSGADIKGGRLSFDYSDGSSDPVVQVKNDLVAAYGNGFLTGQLRSTNATSEIGLGWIDDTGSQKLTVARTYYGDANLDLTVDTVDFGLLAANFGQAGVWAQGDFDYNDTIDTVDFGLLASGFGKPQLGAGDSLGALVPEPMSASLLVGAGLLALRRRRIG